MFYRRRETKSRSKTGIWGERIAAKHFKKSGYRIIEVNYRCKLGEIDIIATKEDFLVFVEVKTRNARSDTINPLISITRAKRQKLRKLGEFFMQESDIRNKQPRFDVIGITLRNKQAFNLEHIENAF